MQTTTRSETSIKKGRSRITNRRAMFPRTLDGVSIDMRGQWTRRLRDLVSSYTSDAGGDDNITEGLRSIIRRVASLQTQMERLESMWAQEEGEATPNQLDVYQRLANTQRRLFETAGLRARSAKAVPSLQEYLKSKTPARSRVTIDHEDDD